MRSGLAVSPEEIIVGALISFARAESKIIQEDCAREIAAVKSALEARVIAAVRSAVTGVK